MSVQVKGSGTIGGLDEGLNIVGVVTATSFSGTTGTFSSTVQVTSGNLDIADSIRHVGDPDTKMRFPTADTISFETAGGESLRITSEGKLGLNFTSPTTIIHASGNNTVGTSVTMTLQSHDTANATSGIDLLARRSDNVNETCKIQAASGGQNSVDLQFHTNNTEKLRIFSNGDIGVNATTVNRSDAGRNTIQFDYSGSDGSEGLEIRLSNSALNGNAATDNAAITYIGQNLGITNRENGLITFSNNGSERLRIDSNGDVCVGNSGNPPWTETGGNYNNISLCGNDASSSGFLNLGNGAAASNADFDLARIKIHNGATEVARIAGTTATSDSGDASIKFFTKKAGAGLKEILRIRNDGFVETMYDQDTGSYNLSASPTPRLRIRNDYGGDGIISSAQFFAKRGSGAASIFDIGVITTSTDYESNLIISSRNTDATYSEKLRIESEGQLRMLYGNNAKQAYVLRSTFRTITGHSSTGYQYVRCALLSARTAYRVCINTTGGNYGPGAQFFTVLRNWDSTTLYVSDKFNMGSAYANAVRLQSDNGGGNWYMEISINLTTTSQGFGLSVIPIGNNAGTMTTNLQYYGSGMSNLTATSSAHSL